MARIVLYPVGSVVPGAAAAAAGAPRGWLNSGLSVLVTAATVFGGTVTPVQPPAPNPGWQEPNPTPFIPIPFPAVAVNSITVTPLATTAGVSNVQVFGEPLNPEPFTPQFSAGQQQWTGFQPLGAITISAPEGWRGAQLEYRFGTPFPIADQPFTTAPNPQFFPPGRGWNGWQLECRFAAPFPVQDQQYVAHQNFSVPTAVTPQGWNGYQFDYLFAAPFPVSDQAFPSYYQIEEPQVGYAPIAVSDTIVIERRRVNNFAVRGVPPPVPPGRGWNGQQFDYAFAAKFPVWEQRYDIHLEVLIPTKPTPQGWNGQQLERLFNRFVQPFPAQDQQFSYYQSEVPAFNSAPNQTNDTVAVEHRTVNNFTVRGIPFILQPAPQGWGSPLEAAFIKPVNVAVLPFHNFGPHNNPPLNQPPGSGKYPKRPSYIPQPPYEATKAKPFRPIWDKRTDAAVEKPAEPAATPAGPPPLPPASLFGAQGIDTSALPTFDHLMPHDPADLARRMREAQDLSDAETVLRALGLLP